MIDLESEPLHSYLSLKSLTISRPLFQTSNSCVFAAYNNIFSQPVALKLQLYSRNFSPSLALREVENQRRVCHENVVKLYRHFRLDLDYNWWVLGLELELMATDLNKEIRRRGLKREHWSEDELMKFLYTMVEVLAEAESLGVAHRDIKPHNIFLDDNFFKLGDFGWSRILPEDPDLFITLSGTPVYLSPALKQGHYLRQKRVRHNPFKSDVFSLGLTVLNIARLTEEVVIHSNEGVEAAVGSIQYQEWVKSCLNLMLQIEESARPDFLTLFSLIKSAKTPINCCPHPPEARFTCEHCFNAEILVNNCRIYSRNRGRIELTETPRGMDTCMRCGKLAANGDLITMSEGLVGLYCGKCLIAGLDEAEIVRKCQSSNLYFLYQAVLNSL